MLKQKQYYVERDKVLTHLEMQKHHEANWGQSYEWCDALFKNQPPLIEYNAFVKLLSSCMTSKMPGNANKGLHTIREWAKQNKAPKE